MKRVLIYGLSQTLGGVESFIINYVNYMPENSFEVDLIVTDKIPEYLDVKLQRSVSIEIVPYRTRQPFTYYRKIKEIVKNGKYDIVWSNVCTLTDIAVIKAGFKCDVSMRIIHSHNSQNMGGKLVMFTHLINKKVIAKYATHFFACSDLAGEFMFGKDIYNNVNYKIIPNAINAKKFEYNVNIRQEIRKELNIEEETMVVGHIGRFHFQKNHKYLIDIFNEFHKENEKSVLLLIGEGGLVEDVKKQVDSLGLSEVVLFLGVRTDVNRLMQAMDVFLLPSVFEGLPIVAIEAQAAGLPCIVSDVISTQVKVTDLLFFESILLPCEVWSRRIMKIMKYQRKSYYLDMVNNGYDIENAVANIFTENVGGE